MSCHHLSFYVISVSSDLCHLILCHLYCMLFGIVIVSCCPVGVYRAHDLVIYILTIIYYLYLGGKDII